MIISKAASVSCQILFEYFVVTLVIAVLLAAFILVYVGGTNVKDRGPKKPKRDSSDEKNETAALDPAEEPSYEWAPQPAAVSDQDQLDQPREERLDEWVQKRPLEILAQAGGNTTDAADLRRSSAVASPVPPVLHARIAGRLREISEENSMPRSPLVCTAGAKFNTSIPLPSEGVCDFTFYDSLHEGGRNPLLGPYDASFEHFAALATSHNRTQYGVGLSFEMMTAIAEIFAGYTGRNVTDSFAKHRLLHYAFVNTPTWATLRDLVIMLKVLKAISAISASTQMGYQRSYTALAAYLKLDVTIKDVASEFKEVYTPDIIISYGHLFEQDQMGPDCKLLPPTFLKLPGSPSYKYSLETAVEDLESLRDQGVDAKWAISVALFGRRYLSTGLPGDPGSDLTSGKPFTRPPSCNVIADVQQLASVAEACSETFSGKCKYSEVLNCEACYDSNTQMMLMYDSAKALRRKLCSLKQQHMELQYGVAVYSVEFADWSNACNSHESFNELADIRRLIDFLPRFVEASNVTACVALSDR